VSQAQTVYRSVGPDGAVMFSDRPPPNASTPSPAQPTAANRGVSNPALPYALREIAARFPVTLYTGADCSPCTTGRALLQERQVPFTERTISTDQDGSALQQLSGDTTLPLLSIGRQQIKGFSDGEWKQYLDAAGYTGAVRLPAGYRNPEPAPLVAALKPPADAAAVQPGADKNASEADRQDSSRNKARAAQSSPGAAPVPARTANPAGIRF
jgi:glutaredoxin